MKFLGLRKRYAVVPQGATTGVALSRDWWLWCWTLRGAERMAAKYNAAERQHFPMLSYKVVKA